MVGIRNKPENKVKKECLNRLDQWQRWGFVIDYDDVSALGKRLTRGGWVMKTVKGKRDIIAIIGFKTKAWVYLIECKVAIGGNWNKEQQEYAQRFAWLDNVIYQVVSKPSQIDETLEFITGRSDNLLKEIK